METSRQPAPTDFPQTPIDVAVIGGGIGGAAVAAELARDHRVALLEAEQQAGYHSTGRSVAMLDLAYGNAVVQALTVASAEPLRELQEWAGGTPFLRPRGVLYVARPDQESAFAQFHERVRMPGHRVEYHDGSFAHSKGPLLRAGYVTSCAWEPDAMEFDVAALLSALLRQFRARGGRLMLGASVEALQYDGEQWFLRGPHMAISAARIINAAGAWADQIASLAGGEPLGLVPMRRTVCTVPVAAAPAHASWPFVVDIDEDFYFKQEAGRLLLSPADETPAAPGDAWPDDLDVALAVERLEAACDLVVARVGHCWAGLRSFFSDRSPAIGPDTALPQFFWCAGLGGYGIQTALGAAAYLGAVLRNTAPSQGLTLIGAEAGLSPARFVTRAPNIN